MTVMPSMATLLALLEIIWINILLSGDNAVVIALACRALPPEQRQTGIWLGAGAAVGLRILFTAMVVTLLALPWLKLVGGLLLVGIAINLVTDQDDGHQVAAGHTLWAAVRIIAIADMVMSLDNVIAIAAAARGNYALLIFGLVISVPLIVFGASLVLKLLERFAWLVWLGAALLGFVAGELIATDPAVHPWLLSLGPLALDVEVLIGLLLALIVLGVGWVLRSRPSARAG